MPQLGVLDYQNISEDLLVFCDTIAAAIIAKSINTALFSTQKAFLPHLGRFMFEHFPDFSHVFYGRPSFKQDGSAIILLRLAVKPIAVSVVNKNKDLTIRQDTAAQNGESEQTVFSSENTEGTQKGIEEQSDNMSDVPNFFSDDDRPHFIMLELGAVKEDTAWKISYIDFKGAEYADSALKN